MRKDNAFVSRQMQNNVAVVFFNPPDSRGEKVCEKECLRHGDA